MRELIHKLNQILEEGWLVIQLLCFLLLIVCLLQVHWYGLNLSEWDSLLLSGVVTFMLGIYLWLDIPPNLETMLDRLRQREALVISKDDLVALKSDLRVRAERWANYAGVLVAFATLVAFVIAFKLPWTSEKIVLATLEVVGAYIAGSYLGRMACYGGLGWLLQRKQMQQHQMQQQQMHLKVQPGHLDGVAGLKPIGDFYFKQAKVVAIPAAFLAVWLLILQLKLIDRYSYWRTSYAGLLGLALVFEVLAFLLPLWYFHQEMVLRKTEHLKEADELGKEIEQMQQILNTEQDAQRRELLKYQIAAMTKQYWDIENLSTWPVAVQTRRLFRRNNLILLLPLVLELLSSNTNLGKSASWKAVKTTFEKWIGQ